MGGIYMKPRVPGERPTKSDPYLWIIPVIAVSAMVGFVLLLMWAINSMMTKQDAEREEIWRGAVVVRVCRDGTHIWKLRDGRMQSGWGVTFDPKRDPKDICD